MTIFTKILKRKGEIRNHGITEYWAVSLLKTVFFKNQFIDLKPYIPHISREHLFLYTPTKSSCIKEFHVIEAKICTIKFRSLIREG